MNEGIKASYRAFIKRKLKIKFINQLWCASDLINDEEYNLYNQWLGYEIVEKYGVK